jgi:hypothetical protein
VGASGVCLDSNDFRHITEFPPYVRREKMASKIIFVITAISLVVSMWSVGETTIEPEIQMLISVTPLLAIAVISIRNHKWHSCISGMFLLLFYALWISSSSDKSAENLLLTARIAVPIIAVLQAFIMLASQDDESTAEEAT